MARNIKVGISIGDINGIGLEVILKTFSDPRVMENIIPVLYGSNKVISFYKKALNMHNFVYQKIDDTDRLSKGKLNVYNLTDEDIKVDMGLSTEEAGKFAFLSLEKATSDLASGKIDVLVTAPINKKNIQGAGFNFPGHTEYLTKMANADESLMLMVKGALRVGIVTNHIPLEKVKSELNQKKILDKVRLLNSCLQKDFGIRRPKIAVMGLNPHAGENGMLGSEEQEIIIPAIQVLEQEGILAFGPYPVDGFFGSASFTKFDGVLAMFHDQGLAPFKALAGGTGVNYTAGLPIVRTSPDHGTAYDIAGKNIASEESFRNAMFLACDVFESRLLEKEINADVLTVQNRK